MMLVFSNLATSIDGKIATARRSHFALGTKADHARMQVLRGRCDAILMGASSLRAFKRPCLYRKARPGRQPLNVVLSRDLSGLDPNWPFFASAELEGKRVLLTTGKVPPARLRRFASLATVVALPPSASRAGKVAEAIVRALGKLGVRRLLVEGGGEVMWHFVSRDLLDEIHLTLTPKLVGGREAPTLIEGEGFEVDTIRTMRLSSVRRIGHELFLVYRRN
ncbi:MAG: dihydrofolate reductase family protein [Bdellovibrionales bacterium]|nr:dihydrofolate reductase family protein [Bdellovibrionales bacterium]